jgi:hypothetical protein
MGEALHAFLLQTPRLGKRSIRNSPLFLSRRLSRWEEYAIQTLSI